MNGFSTEPTSLPVVSKGNSNRKGLFRAIASQTIVAAFVATLVSYWHVGNLEPQARAEPRRITPQEADQHFKSGGRLSETVLQEILVVLKRIDERIERIERSAEQAIGSARGPDNEDDTRKPASSSQIQVRRNR